MAICIFILYAIETKEELIFFKKKLCFYKFIIIWWITFIVWHFCLIMRNSELIGDAFYLLSIEIFLFVYTNGSYVTLTCNMLINSNSKN